MTTIEADVAVLGGGPSGIGAAIGAAQAGARTVLFERHPVLGGMGTAALVNNFCSAHKDFVSPRLIIGGVFATIRDELIRRRAIYLDCCLEAYKPEVFDEVVRELCAKAGVQVLTSAEVAEADIGDRGAGLRLRDGREVAARRVVDATGDATFAHRAGCPTVFGRERDGAVMPMSMCYEIGGIDLDAARAGMPWTAHHDRIMGEDFILVTMHPTVDGWIDADRASGALSIPRNHISAIMSMPGRPQHATVNYSRVFCDDPTDAAQLRAATEEGHRQVADGIAFFRRRLPGFAKVELVRTALQIGVRETRRIRGRHTLTGEEAWACTQFEDVIAQCRYAIDIHEPNSDKTTLKGFPPGKHYDIPWRCLIPADGPGSVIAAGRSISATHEAASSFRVSPSMLAIGEAAGVTAALAARRGCQIGEVGHEPVQAVLREHGGILD
jgi:glycine/D-amino acid oxidase-like deaminating enzyme